MNILLVGCGNMGSALLDRWVQRLDARFTVLDPAPKALPEGVEHCASATDLPDAPFDVVILAVKPQMIADVAPPLAPHRAKGGLLISIAAGTALDRLQTIMGTGPTLRFMPNLPASIGRGMSALAAASDLEPRHKDLAETLAGAVGAFLWVKDDAAIDAFTAVAGSGPGYAFHLMDRFARAAKGLGFSEEDARLMVVETVRGAAELAASSQTCLSDLEAQVTSKGGTTEAGLKALRATGRTDTAATATLQAALERAKDLA